MSWGGKQTSTTSDATITARGHDTRRVQTSTGPATETSSRTTFGGGTGGGSSALSTHSAGSVTNATVVSGKEIADTVAGKRGSWISDKPAGESAPQSQREMLSSTFAVACEQPADAAGSDNFGTDFLTVQQDFASCGWASRRQQQVPDIRLVKEHRHCEPGFRAQLAPPICHRLTGNPIDVSANHTAQNSLAVRQLNEWRPSCRAKCVNCRHHRMTMLAGFQGLGRIIGQLTLKATQSPR